MIFNIGYRYTDPQGAAILDCPACGKSWTEPESIWLEASVAGYTLVGPTQLDDDGCLVDVDRLVACGYHSSTLCGGCDAPLLDLDDIVETQLST